MDFDAYVRFFNKGDDNALIDRYFDDEVEFAGGPFDVKGKEAVRAFFLMAHDGVAEIIRPRSVAREGQRIFVEIDMDFHATKVREDFPLAKLHPGDSITIKFLVTYDLTDEDRIRRLQWMIWPAGKDVVVLPRLGPHATQLAAYRAYIAALNAGDDARCSAFYTDDVTVAITGMPAIVGKDAVSAQRRSWADRARPAIVVDTLLADDDTILADLTIEVASTRDDVPSKINAFVRHDLRDGLIRSTTVMIDRAAANTP